VTPKLAVRKAAEKMLKRWGLSMEEEEVRGTARLRVKRESLSGPVDGGAASRGETPHV
jgi:hypothetical protein